MDEQRARIQEDLRGLLSGTVRCDDVFVQLYASDASIYQIRPLGVVLPRSTEDVVTCVRYAHEHRLPIHARGAGTGLAGQAIGPGLVLDFSRFMRRMLRVDADSVRVQPGVVLERLNQQLLPRGRFFAPDPATSQVTTLGGVIGVDSSGSHWLKYGSARRHVRELEIVTADGHVLEVGREPLVAATNIAFGDAGNGALARKRQLVSELSGLLLRHAELIERYRPRTCVNTAGYGVWDVLSDGQLDVARLLTGSEGTLALVTAATLSTEPVVPHRAVATLLFHSLEKAADAVQLIVALEPSACDLMDRRHLSLARESDPRYDLLIPADAEALLLVEVEGHNPAEVRDHLRRITDRVQRQKKLAFDTRSALETEEMDLVWQLARRVVPTLYRLKGHSRALPFVEDVAVPPAELSSFLVRLQNVLKRHEVTASLFAHAGHGQLHVRPFLDMADPENVRTMRHLAAEMYEAVLDVGGTISGEHGDGLSRSEFLPRQYGELYNVFREIKRIFDPHNIFNPGKVVGEAAELLTRNLRPVALVTPTTAETSNVSPGEPGEPPPPGQVVELRLHWQPDDMVQAARSCNGCGVCRSQADDVRMCPIFRFAPAEEASPRAKANLVRGVLTGQLDPALLAADELKSVADLCVHCHMCRLECPAGVDIPRLMIEAKGAYVANNGLRFSDWALARIDLLSALASRFSPLANWAVANRTARWVIEKTLGIAQARKLPRVAAQPFLRRARKRRLTQRLRRTDPKVLYFVDTYANFHDPDLADAVVTVLEHQGISVYVPPGQKAAGMPLVAVGAIETAKRFAEHNVRLLAEAVRQGYHVVASEPSAALCLVREYPALVDDDDARLVADNTSEICTYLWRLHREGRLKLNFRPLPATVAYHLPCHLKALEVGSPGENLLRLIPALRVHKTEKGCSGMAGTYGMKRQNFRSSLRAGWGLISSLRSIDAQAGASECSTCKMQMEQGTSKPTIHPLKLLALAYGLRPQWASLLTARGEELVVT